MQIYTVYVTCPTHEVARNLARTVVRERLAACANITGEITSIYEWHAELEQTSEVILLLKTSEECTAELTNRLRELHPYECPCIVAWACCDGNKRFFEWVQQQTGKQSGQ